jgi:ribosomal protein L16/L10AE
VSIFGAALDASSGRWIAFNEETLTSLSEHETKADALEACRRYFEREMRRANILQYLTRHAA